MSLSYTPDQLLAMENRGGALLVSAAAGSGKTRVLTERLIRRITDPAAPADVDRFLVITFTRAAAAELRGRITEALSKLSAAHPEDRRLRRQQALCARAHIGTIHSFCAEVLREHCHLLGLPPAFTVLDAERGEQLKRSRLSHLLDRHYAAIDADPAFRLLADTVGAGRDDRRLEQAVLTLYEKLRSQPWPSDWAQAQKTALFAEGVTDLGETVWGRELLEAARAEAAQSAKDMEAALSEICAAGGALEKAYLPSFSATAAALRDFLRALEDGWDRARVFSDIPFPRLGPLRGFDDEEKKERLKAVRERCKRACAALKESFSQSSAEALQDLRATAPAMAALLDLTLELDESFSAEKRRRGQVDYSDLEHYAAALLTDRETGAPTPAATALSARFVEVMVDEYQDVSPVQDLIFRAVSQNERNLFLVGDVKQSIYRFRLADPALFLEKYRAYAPAAAAAEGEPRRILLRENFRSRKSVLEAVNLVFSSIMSQELGELDYDADAALRYGAGAYPEGTDTPAELVVIDADAGGNGELPPEKSELEALYAARRIAAMMRAGTPVYTAEGPRRCRWGDFAVLLRSPGSRGAVFRRILEAQGIPVQSAESGAALSSPEAAVAVDLLTLIDNPHADVPLISALRSPLFGFTPDELGAVRAGSRDTDYYTALRTAAEQGNGKSAAFLQMLDRWRALAPDLDAEELLRLVCEDTELAALCAAMPDASARQNALEQLFAFARAFSAGGGRGLFRFVAYLRELARRGAPAPDAPGAENAVHLLSIHKSKGLEFPFVFLCDLGHRFNRGDERESVLLHTRLGLGPKYTDAALGVEYPTVARRAIARRMNTEMLSEEMRVLYVAMTRARERLVMTATASHAARAVEELRAAGQGPLSPALLRAAPSPARWVALAALRDEARIAVRVLESLEDAETQAREAAFPAEGSEEEWYARIRDNLAFAYPFPETANLPSRLTATDPARDAEAEEAAAITEPEEEYAFRRPELGARRGLTAAERGIAAHSFLQHLDFTKTETPDGLRDEARRIAAAGFLSPEEARSLDLTAVLRLFSSPLGRAMRDAGDALRREFRFTLLANASEYFRGAAEADTLLVQGVVDCFFVENGSITIVDYKTDRVTAAEAPARAERYRSQMRTYAKALRRITGLPVGRCALWFLRPGAEIDLKL